MPTLDCRSAEVVVMIPLADGTEYAVTRERRDELQRLYPGTNAEQVLRAIRGWNLAHPKNRKTKRGVESHINGWFAREQDRGGGNGTPRDRPGVRRDADGVVLEDDKGLTAAGIHRFADHLERGGQGGN